MLDEAALRHGGLKIRQKALNLVKIVDGTINLFTVQTEQKRLKIKNNISASLPAVFADPDRLRQVLHNLIYNAIKFTNEGEIVLDAEVNDNFIEVSVSDTGRGISQEDQEKIFDQFEQVESREEGTGLGLSITKEIVALHGGEIRVASENGKTFTFSLLSTEAEPEETVSVIRDGNITNGYRIEEEESTAVIKSFGNKIMIVDDEAINLRVLKNHLSSYSTSTCVSGQEALDKISVEKPDLVLLDVMMPEMDGFAVCQKLRERYSQTDLPIIFVTAKNRIRDLHKGFEAGGNDYISKPFFKDELLARVELQLTFLNAVNRLSDITEFSNLIADITDIDTLCMKILEFVSRIPVVSNVYLFRNNSLLNAADSTGSQKAKDLLKTADFSENSYWFDKQEEYMFFTVNNLSGFYFCLKLRSMLSIIDIAFIRSLNNQSLLMRRNINRIVTKNNISAMYSTLSKPGQS